MLNQVDDIMNFDDFKNHFSSEVICSQHLHDIRFRSGVSCTNINCLNTKVYPFKNGLIYKCSNCARKFSIRSGTVLGNSKVSLQKWFQAIFIVMCTDEIKSSLELHRRLDITQKTAWSILHILRSYKRFDKFKFNEALYIIVNTNK